MVIALASWCLQILAFLICIHLYIYILESSPFRARIFVKLKTRGWEIVERLYGRYASTSHEPYRCMLKQGTPSNNIQ